MKNKKRVLIFLILILSLITAGIFGFIIYKNSIRLHQDISNDSKLTYTITFNGLNCQTPVLYLYSDNTYEYYYTFSANGEPLIP